MQMLCKVSGVLSDVECPVCGAGFLVYWTRNREVSRAEQREALHRVLREQHQQLDGSVEVHAMSFQVPDTPMPAPRRMRPAAAAPTAVAA